MFSHTMALDPVRLLIKTTRVWSRCPIQLNYDICQSSSGGREHEAYRRVQCLRKANLCQSRKWRSDIEKWSWRLDLQRFFSCCSTTKTALSVTPSDYGDFSSFDQSMDDGGDLDGYLLLSENKTCIRGGCAISHPKLSESTRVGRIRIIDDWRQRRSHCSV